MWLSFSSTSSDLATFSTIGINFSSVSSSSNSTPLMITFYLLEYSSVCSVLSLLWYIMSSSSFRMFSLLFCLLVSISLVMYFNLLFHFVSICFITSFIVSAIVKHILIPINILLFLQVGNFLTSYNYNAVSNWFLLYR